MSMHMYQNAQTYSCDEGTLGSNTETLHYNL